MSKILFLLLFPATLSSQPNASIFDHYMRAQASLYSFNGNVLVAKNGNIIYQQSLGYANYSTGEKLNSNSIFDCGSIAKEFTAMGILLLKDKGKINYTDTLGKFFLELPYKNITVQQLLTHTSGVPNGFAEVVKLFDHNKIATNTDLIRLLASEKPALLFKPGENLLYSGTGFNLLACIIEKISGQPYKIYMDEQVFKPLGMMHTQVANGPRSAGSIPGLVYGYVYSDSLKKHIRYDSLDSPWTTYLTGITGEGMIITTTGDLLKWDRALKNHRLLKEATQQEMLSRQAARTAIPKVQFGYGIRVGKNDFGNYVFHNGYYPGYLSMHICYTDDDITAIVLSNNESHAEFIADALVGIALHKNIPAPYIHKETATKAVSENYAGRYMMRLTTPPYMVEFPVEFIKKNDTLYIRQGNGAEAALKQESATKFFFADGTDQQIEFEPGNNGNIIKVWHTAWGVKKELNRL
ncbi:MAG TPA: serine hydrolase domain-containing protein [Chitinophagaceae bacterium]|nr:serine hydrolase domain-containing protein [Chitinophagaceae bacterium]